MDHVVCRSPWTHIVARSLLCTVVVLLYGCSLSDELALYNKDAPDPLDRPTSAAAKEHETAGPERTASVSTQRPITPLNAFGQDAIKENSFRGSGRFVHGARTSRAEVEVSERDVLLNFENAGLRDVVQVILGDTLKLSYIYDARVQGRVSLQTTRPLPTDAMLSILETVLRMNGAAMIMGPDLVQIIPADEAVRGKLAPELGGGGPPIPFGYSVQIVPLRYVSAAHAQKLLEPFAPPQAVVRADIDRNLLLLAGTRNEIENLLDTVEIFDVDWLAGMSVGIYPLANVDVEVVIAELGIILGDEAEGPLAGLIRFVPVKRLNALLVVTSRPEYIAKVETWVGRLDRGNSTGQNLFVYHLENGKAVELAKILSEIFSGRDFKGDRPPGQLAPGLTPRREAVAGLPGATPSAGPNPAQSQPPATPNASYQGGRSPRRGEGLSIAESADIRIIADEVNNALLILASAQDYQMVEAAIRKLDIVPLQVLVEATIVEVRLTNELRYGVQWFFKSKGYDGGSGRVTLSGATGGSIADIGRGLSYVVTDGAGAVRYALEALEEVTKVRVISSPHLMIQDNQSAEIQVGDEVAVATQQQQSTATDANVINTVQYRETGVILRVTPRVNAGGSISMEVEQEVSQVQDEGGDNLTPTITQRKIKSSVVVQSGETVILGGLIQGTDTLGSSGIPLLARIPVVGSLFGTRNIDDRRTELMVLLSPRIVRDQAEARRVTEEMRRRLSTIEQEALRLPGAATSGTKQKQ